MTAFVLATYVGYKGLVGEERTTEEARKVQTVRNDPVERLQMSRAIVFLNHVYA